MITVIIIIAMAGLIYMSALAVVYYMAFYTNRKRHPKPDEMPRGSQYVPYAQRLVDSVQKLDKVPYEPVYITSYDGLKLFARWYDAGKDAPVSIIFHGYRSTSLRDASGGAPFCMEKGFSVLLVDQRAHGKSEGRTITFGIKERRDCLSWIEYLLNRLGPETKIMLMGVSMGAATVMMSADLELPDNVKAIAADCGYSSPEEIILTVAARMGMPEFITRPLVRSAARIFGGFDINESSAVEAVKHLRIPLHMIHGDDDRFVPCDMSRKIHASNPRMTVLTEIHDAGHGIAYYVDIKKYKEAAGKACSITAGKEIKA